MSRVITRAVAIALVTVTVLGISGHGINVVKHAGPDKAGPGECTVTILDGGNIDHVNYDAVKTNVVYSVPVQITCSDVHLSAYSLSYHTYDGNGHVLQFDNPRAALHDGHGVIDIPAGSLASLDADHVVLKPDLVKGKSFWVSRRYKLHTQTLAFSIDSQDIAGGLRKQLSSTHHNAERCRVNLQGQHVFNYDSTRIVKHPLLSVRVTTNCASLAGRRLTYHVIGADGQLVGWNVDADEAKPAEWPVKKRPSPLAAVFSPVSSTSRTALWTAALTLDIYRYRQATPGKLYFVPDVLKKKGSQVLRRRISVPVITVDYRIPRLVHKISIVPRLLPSHSMMEWPGILDRYSANDMTSRFKAAGAFVSKSDPTFRVGGTRRSLPRLSKGDNWDVTWVSVTTPPAGVYQAQVGLVNDPVTWYGFMFKPSWVSVVVVNPLVFFACSLLGLWFFVQFCKRIVASPRWYGKLLYLCSAAIVFYLTIVPTILSTIGIATLVAVLYAWWLLSAKGKSYTCRLWLVGFVFGFAMEFYWAMGQFSAPWYAVELSVVIQGTVLFLLLLPWRKPAIRLTIALAWFFVWLCLYLTFDMYARYFGTAPTLNVFTYAGQSMELTGEIAHLFKAVDLAGIAVWAIFPAVTIIGWQRHRLAFRRKDVQ